MDLEKLMETYIHMYVFHSTDLVSVLWGKMEYHVLADCAVANHGILGLPPIVLSEQIFKEKIRKKIKKNENLNKT